MCTTVVRGVVPLGGDNGERLGIGGEDNIGKVSGETQGSLRVILGDGAGTLGVDSNNPGVVGGGSVETAPGVGESSGGSESSIKGERGILRVLHIKVILRDFKTTVVSGSGPGDINAASGRVVGINIRRSRGLGGESGGGGAIVSSGGIRVTNGVNGNHGEVIGGGAMKVANVQEVNISRSGQLNSLSFTFSADKDSVARDSSATVVLGVFPRQSHSVCRNGVSSNTDGRGRNGRVSHSLSDAGNGTCTNSIDGLHPHVVGRGTAEFGPSVEGRRRNLRFSGSRVSVAEVDIVEINIVATIVSRGIP
jgi:hypothetical protein